MADLGGKFRRDPPKQAEPQENTQNTCPCEGAYNTGTPNLSPHSQHFYWVAFLHYNNTYCRREEWLRDYRILPTNWLTCKLSGSDIFHCQIFFWNQMQQTHVTFSVDAHQKEVHYSTEKQFGDGWTFIRVSCTMDQERIMYDFLAAEAMARKPFNWTGAMTLFFRPIDTGGTSWFCSQLCVAAMQKAGFLLGIKPEAVYPALLLDLLKRATNMTILESQHPIKTKEVWMRVQQQLSTGIVKPNEELLIRF